ncbi:MAG: DUF2927 domain-containing protein [Rhodobacteraceae bacterium]|nr:DUF2927 domain-containing protein [Paracoccaceae bacterium]
MRQQTARLAIGGALLAGCVPTDSGLPVSDPPSDATAQEFEAMPPPLLALDTGPLTDSDVLAQHYQRLQNSLLVQGLLRQDGGGPDTPFTAESLADDFINIALLPDTSFRRQEMHSFTPLHRWQQPLRMSVEFGASVPAEQQEADRARIARYGARMARLTGLTVQPSGPALANFTVLILNEAERLASETRIRALLPEISLSVLRDILNPPRRISCLVVADFEPGRATYNQAVVIIRAELPDLLRQTCIHEEIAQGLGLPNDSAQAYPSIFNDNDEFGFLTTHDEMLLQMLYDPRLSPGMTYDNAVPIIRQIAAELTGTDLGTTE